MGDTFSDWTEDTGEIVSCWTMEMILSGTERQKRQQATSRAIAMHAIAIGKATAQATVYIVRAINNGIRDTSIEDRDTAISVRAYAVDIAEKVVDLTNDNVVQPAKDAWNNSKIGQNVNNFNWNNTSEQTVLSSNYFSAYKEKLLLELIYPVPALQVLYL